ncbi:MAG: sulfurtransferase TusA family protein, partial [Candidatus Latescibacterota bacterium]
MENSATRFYEIPDSLAREIDELEFLIFRYRAGEITSGEIKARRVPFGVYEQRKEGAYMVRIRCTGGGITPSQLTVVAELSEKYGRDSIHLTTRQEVQIHGVALENVIPVIRALREADLATRGGGGNTVRNIMASWDSGISPDEEFDVLPHAVALTNRLIEDPDSWTLPRKYKISFSSSPSDNAHSVFNDLGFVAQIRDGVKGFSVFVAGGMGTHPQAGSLLCKFIPAGRIYLVAEAIKRLFSKNGNRKNKHSARLRFLWNKLGRDVFIEHFESELAELESQDIRPVSVTEIENRKPESIPLEPVRVESESFTMWKRRYVREQKQPGLNSILVPVFLGDLTNAQAKTLAALLHNFGDNVIRFTMCQNLSIRNIPDDYLGNVYQTVSGINDRANRPSFISGAVACTGADTCKLGICLPRGAVQAIERKLVKSGIDLDGVADIKLHLSGCPNTCGRHMVADLGFYGKAARKGQALYPAYTIVAGAVTGVVDFRLARKVGEISARDLPDFVTELLRVYLRKKDRYSSFHAYIDGGGEDDIQALCDLYRDIPAFGDDKNYYFDWGSEQVFSLVGRGAGECSAGLFDLIDLDRTRIADLMNSLEKEGKNGNSAEAMYQMALYSARMLLITRGVEASTDRMVFESFQEHFIQAGLIDQEYADIIEHAGRRDTAALSGWKDRIFALSGAVERLYESM